MDCPNGCRYPLEVIYEGEWDEQLHCNDCGANWSWPEATEYAEKRFKLKEEMATPCTFYVSSHVFKPTLIPTIERCRCGKVVNTDCRPSH